VLQAGKVALDVGWAREEFQIGRGRESGEGEGEGERGGFWNGLPFLTLAGLFIVEGRREGGGCVVCVEGRNCVHLDSGLAAMAYLSWIYDKTTQEFGKWYDKTCAGIAKVSQEEAQWNP
jgi:hypothetical protein